MRLLPALPCPSFHSSCPSPHTTLRYHCVCCAPTFPLVAFGDHLCSRVDCTPAVGWMTVCNARTVHFHRFRHTAFHLALSHYIPFTMPAFAPVFIASSPTLPLWLVRWTCPACASTTFWRSWFGLDGSTYTNAKRARIHSPYFCWRILRTGSFRDAVLVGWTGFAVRLAAQRIDDITPAYLPRWFRTTYTTFGLPDICQPGALQLQTPLCSVLHRHTTGSLPRSFWIKTPLGRLHTPALFMRVVPALPAVYTPPHTAHLYTHLYAFIAVGCDAVPLLVGWFGRRYHIYLPSLFTCCVPYAATSFPLPAQVYLAPPLPGLTFCPLHYPHPTLHVLLPACTFCACTLPAPALHKRWFTPV
jgi:hypothetical protein